MLQAHAYVPTITRPGHRRPGKNTTKPPDIPEARLWGCIRRSRLGVRFRRQVPIGPWIVDFACLDPRIVIEVDDPSHDWSDEVDRTRYLESRGFTILRFANRDIIAIDAVIRSIEAAIRALHSDESLPWA